ncbi:NACHT domain-containing protein [Aphelenchoides fujianensis]|nr:NACHT domain-containing protein [Aphelenchoides fujianensis]
MTAEQQEATEQPDGSPPPADAAQKPAVKNKKRRHASQPARKSNPEVAAAKSSKQPSRSNSNSKKPLISPAPNGKPPSGKKKPAAANETNGAPKKRKAAVIPAADGEANGEGAAEAEAAEKPPIQKSASMPKLPDGEPAEQPGGGEAAAPKKPLKEADKRVAEVFNRVFMGIFKDIPPPLSKLVRVFTSSTFTDTQVERNALMEDVYPALKRYCRETYGNDFQAPFFPLVQSIPFFEVVDMRWGVRDEATDDHKTTDLCINEIHNCQRLSVGPNFVVFLGQKYGYRPIPSQILSTELELLKQVLKEQHDDTSVLDLWYTEDSNAVPAQFILQPISSILVNFNNKRIPKLQEQDAKSWWEVEAKMQNLLRKGAKICFDRQKFTQEQMHNYFMSVTEREVIHGILQANNPNEHCLCYVRQIKNININQTSTASKFIDIVHKQINQEAQKLLSVLRDERVPEVLRTQNIRRSTVEWAGREGMDVRIHADYLKEFTGDFYSSITNMVDAAMRKHAKFRDPFFVEVLQHLWNGITASSHFFGREGELKTGQEYLRSAQRYADDLWVSVNQKTIHCCSVEVYGEHGCGKTSILARIATECRRWFQSGGSVDPILILRFLGTTADSSGIGLLLTSVCEQIACNYAPALRKQCPTEMSKLFQHFKRNDRLRLARTTARLQIIILDSLDLLSKVDGSDELLWFPPTLPPHVKLIVSYSSETKIEKTMRKLVEKEGQYVLVPPLGSPWEIVAKAVSQCSLPLFLKLVYATVFRPQEVVLFKSVQQSIHALFDRTESQHGKLLVSHALSYITAAKSGISDSELEDLISLDDKYHLPPVRRIPPLLWSRIRADLPGYLSERAADGVIVLNWYHEQFRAAANERYFKNLNHLQNTHSSCADYFLGIWAGVPNPTSTRTSRSKRFGVVENEGLADRKVPKQANFFRTKDSDQIRYNSRKLNELPFHLLRARRWKELFSLCLFNFEFLQSKLCSFPLQVIISDFEDAIGKCDDADACRQLNLVMDGLRLSASLLSRFPWMFAFELAGRLLPLVNENEDIKSLLKGCDLQGHEFNCFKPAHHSRLAVFGMDLSSDQKMLVSCSNQLVVWDCLTGDLTRMINPNIEGIFLGMALSSDDKYAAAYTNNNQNVLLWSSSQFYLYDLAGTLLHRERIDPTVTKKNLLEVFFKNKRSVKFVTSTGDKNDWDVTISGREENKQLQPFTFAASLAFFDNRFLCGRTKTCRPPELLEIHGGQVCLKKVVADNMEERTNAIFYWKRPTKADGTPNNWMVAVQTQGFLLCPNILPENLITLTLPDDVRNIPVRPDAHDERRHVVLQ